MKKRYLKWLFKHVSDIKGKTFVVTGATGSIGKAVTRYLSFKGASIIIAVRNRTKGNDLINELRKEFSNNDYYLEIVDFSSIESTKCFVNNLSSYKIDYFISTAGVYHLPQKITDDGMEIHYETNYYNQIKVIESLGKKLKYIIVSSLSHRYTKIDFENIMSLSVKNRTKVYARSKRLLNYHLVYLINQGFDIRITHPGVSPTSLFAVEKGGFGKLFSKLIFPLMKLVFHSPEKGALTVLYAIDNVPKYGKEIGPRGLFGVWGYPKVVSLPKALQKEEKQLMVIECYNLSKNDK